MKLDRCLLSVWLAVSIGCQPGTKQAAPESSAALPPGASAATAAGGVGQRGPGATGAPQSAAQAVGPADCAQVRLAPQRIWRLTAAQYDNTLKDLLGMESSFGAGFPADEVGVGFSNAADALLMTPLLADKLQSAAEDTANSVPLAQLAGCAAGSSDDNCLRQVVSGFGRRAFRRPLTPDEVDRYFKLAKQAGNFEGGARLIVSAMLQSPSFLYRFEIGQPSATTPGTYELDDYEIASELSYLIWQSMPDETLFQAAERRELRDPVKLQLQVDRLFKSERARPVIRKFVFDWLGLSAIPTVPKDTARYPELTAEIRAAMLREAERFVDNAMFGADPAHDGSVRALLNADTTFLDDKLATFYGVAAPSGAVGTQLPAQDRRGILTLGGVLLTHSRSNDSSPIHRGKLVREKLLCQPLPPPPPGLVLQPPGLDPTKTARERYAEHSSNSFCHNCHKLMDPIGLAFEHFDGIGRYRANENGLPIDPSGEIVPNDNQQDPSSDADGPFASSAQLTDLLVNSQDVQRCYALEWFRFAYGEGKTERDSAAYPSCQAKRFQDIVGATDGSLQQIVYALVRSDWFQNRSGSPDLGAMDEPAQVSGTNPASPSVSTPQASDAGAPEMQAPAGLEVTLSVNNDWGMGYCKTYQLHNASSAPITWSVPLEVRGSMNNHWECKVSGDTGMVVFTGEDHNKTIAPNGMAQFGFCAMVK